MRFGRDNRTPAFQLTRPTFLARIPMIQQTWPQVLRFRSHFLSHSLMKNLSAFLFPFSQSAKYRPFIFFTAHFRRASGLSLPSGLLFCHRYGQNGEYCENSPYTHKIFPTTHLQQYRTHPFQIIQSLPPHTARSGCPNQPRA